MGEQRPSFCAIYRLVYHFVIIAKNRKPVLCAAISHEVRSLIPEESRMHYIEIVQGYLRPERVHLLPSVPSE